MEIKRNNKGYRIQLYIDKVVNLEDCFREVDGIIRKFNPSGKAILWKYNGPINDEDPVMTSDFYSKDHSFQARIKVTNAYVGVGLAFHKEVDDSVLQVICKQYYNLAKEIAESLSYICFVKYIGEIEYTFPKENELKQFIIDECPDVMKNPDFLSFAFNYKFPYLSKYYLQIHTDLRVILPYDEGVELKAQNIFVILVELNSLPLFEKKGNLNEPALLSIWNEFFKILSNNHLTNYINAKIN